MTAQITILISGRGSNMQAIHKACCNGTLNAHVTHVISNESTAGGLDYAKQHGIHTTVVNHQDFNQRTEFDTALANTIDQHGTPDLVLLAGFMRRLTATFTKRFEGILINIHPSLLPKHPGLNTHARALQCGDSWHGCSVHFVNEALDGGPLIARGIVPVLPDDTQATLAARVLTAEHHMFPHVAQLFLHGDLACQESRVTLNHRVLNGPFLYHYG